jgi:PAS domain S-box-containing protein
MKTAGSEPEDLRQVFDAMVDGVIHFDAHGRIILANRAACRMLGWDPTARELVDLGLKSRLFARDGSQLTAHQYPAARALAGETLRDFPLLFRSPSGQTCVVVTSASPFVRDGEITGAIVSFHDVTLQEAALQELREAAGQSAALARIGGIVGSTLEVDEIMRAAIRETCEAVGAETAAIVMRRDGAWLTTYSYHWEQDIIGIVLTDEEAPHAAMALASAAPVAIDDALNDPRVNREVMEGYGVRSVLTMPLIQKSTVIGAMFMNHHSKAVAFSQGQIDFAAHAAATISLALRNAELFDNQRRVADTLQQAMLTLPDHIPDVQFSCLYHSATESARVGGDFYDIFRIPGRRIGVVVGDVPGKGLAAAATAAMAKNVIKAYALVGERPSEVLRMANEALRPSLDAASFVTILFGVLDVDAHTLTYSSGGHPPALLLRDGAPARFLSEGGTVVGAFADAAFGEQTQAIEPGETLMLYTDGLTEARWEGALYGEPGLSRAVAAAPEHASPERLVEYLFFDVLDFAGGQLSDDLALLAVRLAPADS